MSVPKSIYVYCKECAKVVQKYVPDTCEHVGGKASVGRSAAPLTTYFEGPNGEVSMPAKVDAKMPRRLQCLGYQIRTIQDSHQYSQFCKKMDAEAREKHEAIMEAQHEQFSKQQKARREEAMAQMQTQFGKDFLNEAIRQSEQSSYGRGQYSAGTFLEGFEYDGKRGHEYE